METRSEMIKEVDVIGWTPLHYSVWLEKIEITQLFLQQDSSAAYTSDKEGQCPLHLAASTGQIDAYRELVGSCPYVWELVDGKGRTSLHSAVISGQRGIIQCILDMPEISLHLLNESDVDGNTPLHLSVVYKCHTILVLFLRNKRVDKLVMNRNHLTAAELFYSQKQEVTLHYLLFMCAEHSILSSSCCSRALRKLTKPNRTKIHFSVRVGLIVWFCFAIFKNVLVFGSVPVLSSI